ncbi:MAG: hypothetical protein KDK70_13810 [Myxococcales bacterium]|nr:hypothetical protein [Myxococcales bacterium]
MDSRLDPSRALLHPAWLGSLAVLALNDHVLKGSGLLPAALTGKLSDVAGLLVAPVLLAMLLRVRRFGPWLGCHLAVGAVFAAIQLSSDAAAGWSAVMGAVGFPWVITMDATDLLALPALALSLWGFVPTMRRPAAAQARRLAECGAASVGLLCCVATSDVDQPPCCEDEGWEDSGDPEQEPWEDPELPPFQADLFLHNDTGVDQIVRIRPLRADVVVDCEAVGQEPGALLRSTLFAPAATWTLPPDANLAVVEHTAGQAPCYAAWIEADTLPVAIAWWTDGQVSMHTVPAHGHTGQPGELLLQPAAESGLLPRVSMASSLPVRPTSAQVLRRPPTGPVAPVRLPEPDVIDRLAQIVAFWRRYRALLLALPMLGLVAGLLSPRLIPPPMVAQFELSLVQDPSDNPVDPVARRNLTFFRSARDNFLSPELVAHTLQELGEPEPAPELVAQTQERLAFERASQYMYHGSYEAPEGEDATTFLRVHLDLFLETEVAKAIKVLTAEVETLRTELTDVDAELTSVEATRAAFKMEAGDAQPEHTLALQRRMLDLRDDRREAASMADRMGATVDIAKSRLGSEDPILEQRIADAKPFTEEITATEKQLIAARAQGQGDEHPNVKGLEARLAGLEDRHQEMLDKGGDHIEVRSNPAYAKAKLSLSEARSLHKVARSDLARTEAEIEQLEKVLEELPAREAEQAALDRRYEALQKQHDEMQIRLASSELQLALERRQIEARFDLVKPPTAAPQSDREVVLTRAGVGTLLGLVMAVMLGMGHTTWERVGERIAAQQPRPGDSTIDALSRANALAVRPASTTLAPRPPSNRYRAVERKRRVTRSVPAVRRDRPRRR